MNPVQFQPAGEREVGLELCSPNSAFLQRHSKGRPNGRIRIGVGSEDRAPVNQHESGQQQNATAAIDHSHTQLFSKSHEGPAVRFRAREEVARESVNLRL